MTSKGLRLLAYGRVSDTRGRSGESFISPEDQMAKCRSYAETYEHTILEEALDLDVSGGVMSRPVLDRFLAQIREGKAQGLIVAKLDRFSRSSRGALNALAEIEEAGGVLISVQEQIDSTTAAGRFVRAIFLATAEWERERIGEAWVTAKTSAVQRGVHISRHTPPGYVKNGGGRLEPDPKHARTVKKAFQMAAEGATPAHIAEYLTKQKLPSGDNLTPLWKSSRIKRLLANPVYKGQARASADVVNNEAHTPIVDETTWLLAQREPVSTPVKRESSYLLSGLVRCASCRHSMRGQKATKHAVAVYRCSTETVSGRCPHPSSISLARLDEIVFEASTERMFAEETPEPEARDDSAALAALEEARTEVAEVEALRGRGELGPVAYGKALEEALADVEAAEKEITSRQARSAPISAAQMATMMAMHEENMARLLAGESVSSVLLQPGPGWDLLRHMLASEIKTVFVRPPVRRSKSLPVSDRVKIIWKDDAEELELPTRGSSKVFEPITWEAA